MIARPEWVAALPASWQWLQFAPLVLFQVVAIAWLFRWLRPPRTATRPVADRPPARPAPA